MAKKLQRRHLDHELVQHDRAISATTENLSNAPTLTDAAFIDGGTLYWRVAAIDEGNNVGGFATGQFKTPKRMVVTPVAAP